MLSFSSLNTNLKNSSDDQNLYEDVSYFNLEKFLIIVSENDMMDEEFNDTPLQTNMSVPPENPENRRCVLEAFTCLHMCTFMSVVHIR